MIWMAILRNSVCNSAARDLKPRLPFNLNDGVVETFVALVGHDLNRRLLRSLEKFTGRLKLMGNHIRQAQSIFRREFLTRNIQIVMNMQGTARCNNR